MNIQIDKNKTGLTFGLLISSLHLFWSVLVFILYHIKECWNHRGFLFGMASFYAYMGITSYASSGKINLACDWFGCGKIILYLGIFFTILSFALLVWETYFKFLFKKNKNF